MTFNDYLNIDIDSYREIFNYHLEYLDNLLKSNFPYDEYVKFSGISEKFIICVKYSSYISNERIEEYESLSSKLVSFIGYYRRRSSSRSFLNSLYEVIGLKNIRHEVEAVFTEYYSQTLSLINEVSSEPKFKNNLRLNGFYQPNYSNKNKIRQLIEEAIQLINDDDTISQKTKKQIIDYLNSALNQLDSQNTNWSKLIGQIKEIVIVLGALGSFVGDVGPLIEARDKLEASTNVIQNTAVNINHNVLNETFNVNVLKGLSSEDLNILLLEEKNDDSHLDEE